MAVGKSRERVMSRPVHRSHQILAECIPLRVQQTTSQGGWFSAEDREMSRVVADGAGIAQVWQLKSEVWCRVGVSCGCGASDEGKR